MRILQIFEYIRDNGIISFWKEVIFISRKAIIVEKDLSEATFKENLFGKEGVQFVELTSELFCNSKYIYPVINRYYKALHYLSQGYAGHAIVRGNMIIGDIWYFGRKVPGGEAIYHKALDWLKIVLPDDCVYSFDIYFIPPERGKNISAALQSGAMYSLYKKGYRKAYAYYWADNVPAVWNTRVINRWQELKSLKVNRFLLYRKVVCESNLHSLQFLKPHKKGEDAKPKV